MSNFIVIFLCMLAGIFCKKLRHFPAQTSQVLNSFVIYLSLPALILSQVPNLLTTINFQGLWWLPISMAWLTFVFSFLSFNLIGKK